SEAQKKALLPEIASGQRVFALAFTEAQFGWTAESIKMKAAKAGSDYSLSGTKVFVDDAEFATDLLVVARVDAGISLFRVDAKAKGVAIRPLAGFMSAKSEVVFDKAAAEL